MPVKSAPSMGWTRKSAAVSVLLAMDEYREEAGRRLRQLREQRGLSQEELAAAAKLSVKTISRFENGKHDGRRGTLRQLGEALGVSEEDITGPPPAPLGLGVQADGTDERLVALLESVQDLLRQQNGLLARQSEILERIERAAEREEQAKKETEEATKRLLAAADAAHRALRSSTRSPAPARGKRAT